MYKTSQSVIDCSVSSDCSFKKKLFSDVAKLYGAYKWITPVSRKEVETNGMKGYEITFDTNYMNKPMKVYILVTGDNKATISYTGMANNDIDKTFKQIKQISKTLKSK